MSMTDSFDIRPLPINQEVHRQLARGPLIIQRATVKVSNRDQVFGHSTFAGHRRRRQDAVVIKLHTDISVGRNNVAALIQQMTDAQEISACKLFVQINGYLFYVCPASRQGQELEVVQAETRS